MGKLLLMAVGGAGMHIAERIKSQFDCDSIAVNSNHGGMRETSFDARLSIGDYFAGERMMSMEQSRKAVQSSRYAFQQALAGYKKLLIVTGLGGATGSGATPAIVALASALEIRTLAAVCLPFAFEKERRELALQVLSELQNSPCTLLVSDNAKDQQTIGQRDMPMTVFFALQAEEIAKNIHASLYAS